MMKTGPASVNLDLFTLLEVAIAAVDFQISSQAQQRYFFDLQVDLEEAVAKI